MKHICFTHVDADTKIPCTVEPMRTGPSFPNVSGLNVVWWDESQWPTYEPMFYGTCDDEADVTLPGVIRVLSEQEYNDLHEAEMDARWALLKPRLNDMVLGGLDGLAATHGYNDIDAVIALADCGDPEKEADADHALTLQQSVLAALEQFVAEVEAGDRPRPAGAHEVIPFLPELVWRDAVAA